MRQELFQKAEVIVFHPSNMIPSIDIRKDQFDAVIVYSVGPRSVSREHIPDVMSVDAVKVELDLFYKLSASLFRCFCLSYKEKLKTDRDMLFSLGSSVASQIGWPISLFKHGFLRKRISVGARYYPTHEPFVNPSNIDRNTAYLKDN